jgi:myo-inositol-1(or 4)-monophosphatase
MALRSALMNVMAAAARKAARGLVRDFGEVEQLQVSRKGPADFVSQADHKAEQVLKAELKKARPSYGFLMEESGASPGTDPQHRWLVDPLDGTTNFLHGIPHFCISIGLQRGPEIVAALVFDPTRDESFWAEKGHGAYLNERRIRVSARGALPDSVIATGIPFMGRAGHERFLAEAKAIMSEVAGVRRFGSAALDLAYVAAGRYDGFWEHGLAAWDMAAGLLLVREAGGFVTDLDGGEAMLENGEILAANDKLHRPLLSILGGARVAAA